MNNGVRICGWWAVAPAPLAASGRPGLAVRLPAVMVHPRMAFTLVELLVALALLVVLVSLTLPGIMNLFFEQKLQRAAASLQRELSNARMAAITEGEPFQFEYEPDGARYRFGPHDVPLAGEGTSASAAADQPGTTAQEFVLSDGLRFRSVSAASSLGSESATSPSTAAAASGSPTGTVWAAPIVFQPDGSSQDATFEVIDPEQPRPYVEVRIRGLTGQASVRIGRGSGVAP